MLSLPGQNPCPGESRSRPAKHCKWGSDTSEQDCPHNGSPREAPPAGMCAQFAERRSPAQGGPLPLCRKDRCQILLEAISVRSEESRVGNESVRTCESRRATTT